MQDTDLQILTYADLQKLGYGSRSTIWRKVQEKKFPQPRSRNGQPVWRKEDIKRYFNSLPEYSPSMPENLKEAYKAATA